MFERQGYSPADIKDLGSAIIKISENIVKQLVNAPFIAKVVAVNNNKVDVQPLDILTRNGVPLDVLTFYDILVGMPFTKQAHISLPIKEGDIGLCIVCDRDLQNYINTGGAGEPPSRRRFSKMDSIFIPLSMYAEAAIDESFKISMGDDINIDIKSDVIVIKNTDDLNIEMTTDKLTIKNKDLTIILDNNSGAIGLESGGGKMKLDNSGVDINDGALKINV